jgi:hypothetical protein
VSEDEGVTAVPDDLLRRLYEAPPERFVAQRDEAAAAARGRGDRDAAKRVAALRKPTVAAWLVNLLALRRPELLSELVQLAKALRTAQRNLRGDELRGLSEQRRKVVSALVAQARDLAVEADPDAAAGKLPLADVEATLTAALADEAVAEQVRSGRLVRTVTYAGFGEVPRPRLRLLTGGDEGAELTDDESVDAGETDGTDEADEADEEAGRSRGSGTAVRPGRTDRLAAARDRHAAEQQRAAAARRAAARRALEREVAAAQTAVERAEVAAEEAADAEHAAARSVAELDAQIADLERRRAGAQSEVSRTKLAHKSAQRDVAIARRRLGDLQGALDELDG